MIIYYSKDSSSLDDILFFRKNVCISEVLEEVYYYKQYLNKTNIDIDEPKRSIINEIEAKEYLLNSDLKYKIPRKEIEITKK